MLMIILYLVISGLIVKISVKLALRYSKFDLNVKKYTYVNVLSFRMPLYVNLRQLPLTSLKKL